MYISLTSLLHSSSECGQWIRTKEWPGNPEYNKPPGHSEGETPETNCQEQIKEAGKKYAEYNYM